jgi:hypothetical protein
MSYIACYPSGLISGPMLPVFDGRENLYTPHPVPTIPDSHQAAGLGRRCDENHGNVSQNCERDQMQSHFDEKCPYFFPQS